jgi:hypothetical protein
MHFHLGVTFHASLGHFDILESANNDFDNKEFDNKARSYISVETRLAASSRVERSRRARAR